MGESVTLGGDRLGSGKKNQVYLHGYERSTHNLGGILRTTVSPGTLVPFMTHLALPGDTWDIKLDTEIMTKPTEGPLFGSFKVQMDVFQIPIRLFQGLMQINGMGQGREVDKILFPQMLLTARNPNADNNPDNYQINPSSIFSYLGITGLGGSLGQTHPHVARYFNALAYLSYYETGYQYYSNKQEEIMAMIHKRLTTAIPTLRFAQITDRNGTYVLNRVPPPTYTGNYTFFEPDAKITIGTIGLVEGYNAAADIVIEYKQWPTGAQARTASLGQMFEHVSTDVQGQYVTAWGLREAFWFNGQEIGLISALDRRPPTVDGPPEIITFPAENIVKMRKAIMRAPEEEPFVIDKDTMAPYGLPLEQLYMDERERYEYSKEYAQEGLLLKTYNSDIFNNWLNKEFIEGPNGVNEVTAVVIQDDKMYLDEFNIRKKIFNMLNRIEVSGGTLKDYYKAVYDVDSMTQITSPVYLGGLMKELVFQEVVSQAQAQTDSSAGTNKTQPLGTLAGRGKTGGHSKGGKVTVKVEEPSYIMGIFSLTPRIDYAQGNNWDVNLKTLDDLHKPALDEIGFQDLITDQMAAWDTKIDMMQPDFPVHFKSAGKTPAWINYMTNYNRVKGNFAMPSESFMVLPRRYEWEFVPEEGFTIKDLTTYIDPSKYNHIFADARLDAMNYWVQIGTEITARRKMSAKVMPNP